MLERLIIDIKVKLILRDNTTATMDEIKPYTGLIWPRDSCLGITDNIDACRNPHFDVTSFEVKGSSHNVCLECIQLAAQHMSPLEHRRISRLRRTICSKHTREDITSAQHEPCKCLVILDTEWRCWECRKSTLRGLTGIAMRRRNALDEAHYDDDADNHNSDDYPNGGTDDHGDEGHIHEEAKAIKRDVLYVALTQIERKLS